MEHTSGTISNNNKGDKLNINSEILEIQKMLSRLNIKDIYGNKIIEDGMIGVRTCSGIRRLQCVLGLEMNGLVTSDIINAINYIASKPILSLSYENNIAVRYIQWRLGIAVDGVYGSVTKAAVTRFQIINNIEPTGIAAEKTWLKLIS